jgi:hypothetical protein
MGNQLPCDALGNSRPQFGDVLCQVVELDLVAIDATQCIHVCGANLAAVAVVTSEALPDCGGLILGEGLYLLSFVNDQPSGFSIFAVERILDCTLHVPIGC